MPLEPAARALVQMSFDEDAVIWTQLRKRVWDDHASDGTAWSGTGLSHSIISQKCRKEAADMN